jgi:hypothetical protein
LSSKWTVGRGVWCSGETDGAWETRMECGRENGVWERERSVGERTECGREWRSLGEHGAKRLEKGGVRDRWSECRRGVR